MLAPAAIGPLMPDKPIRRFLQGRIVGRYASGAKTLHRMEGGVREVDAPEAGPRAIGALPPAKEMDRRGDGAIELRAETVRIGCAVVGQGRQTGTCAFEVRSFGHAGARDLGG